MSRRNLKSNNSSIVFHNAGISDDQARSIWRDLSKAIEEIQEGNASKLRFEELYRNSYTLVLHKHGDLLYGGVTQCIQRKLGQICSIVANATSNLLEVMVEQWNNHKLVMGMIRDILMYMDKTYCQQQKKMPVYQLGLVLFRDQVIHHDKINDRLKSLLLENVFKERNKEIVDRVVMRTCLSMLVEVDSRSRGVYQQNFEQDFLLGTKNFYQQESQDFIAQNTCPDYLCKVEARLWEEEERADTYLDPSTKHKLRAAVQHELITKYAQRLVEDEKTGCAVMFNRNQIEDLGRMYALFSREPETLVFIQKAMSNLVREVGTRIVRDEQNLKDPTLFVEQVLAVRATFFDFVHISFLDDRSFSKVLKEALQYFINLDNHAAQYLALYIDQFLRKGVQGMLLADVDARLDEVISILKYLHDRDVFEDYYKHHLSQRLLTGSTTDEDIERLMIYKLKVECGHQFTSRLEGMFKDMKASSAMVASFREHLIDQRKATGENKSAPQSEDEILNVTILTTGFWPLKSVPPCILPQIAAQQTDKFWRFYRQSHTGKILSWQTNRGTAELRCPFEAGNKDLIVYTYQMCILFLFNDHKKLTFQEIQDKTGIPRVELTRHILSLAHPKVRVLRKKPNSKECAPDHQFMYNFKYTNKLRRVKIPLLSLRACNLAEDEKKTPVVPTQVVEARKNRVEASIVRIMKHRKTLEHSALVEEVIHQMRTRFHVEPTFIKKRIESLLDREYIERDTENRRLYHYIA